MIRWIHHALAHKHWKDLGFSRPDLYVSAATERGQNEAYRIVKVAEKLPLLPRSLAAFEKGKLTLEKLKLIASIVEEAHDEDDWLEFALKHRQGVLEKEIRAALDDGRDRPRKNAHGLPNVKKVFTARLTLETYEILRKALEKAAREKMLRKGADPETQEEGERPTEAESLEHLARRFLELAWPDGHEESVRERCATMVVYMACRSSKEAFVMTGEGMVEVPWERIEDLEGRSGEVELTLNDLVKGEALPPGEIDRSDVPAEVEFKVLLIHGGVCARCGCPLDVHVHHVVFRSKGGKNVVWNLLPLCARDHALVHAGLLEVFCDSLGHLYWRTKSDRVEFMLREEFAALAAIPQAPPPPAPPGTPSPSAAVPEPATAPVAAPLTAPVAGIAAPHGPADASPSASGEREEPDPEPMTEADLDDRPKLKKESEGVMRALRSIGYRAHEARERVLMALGMLAAMGRAPAGDEIMSVALGSRRYRDLWIPTSRKNGGRRDGTPRVDGKGGAPGGAS